MLPDPTLTALCSRGRSADQANTRKHVIASHGVHGPPDARPSGGHQEKEGEEEEIDDLLYALLTRKEVSVGWKDTSIPHLLGYGSLLYVVEQLLMYPSDLLKTRLQADTRPVVNLAEVRGAMRRVCMRLLCDCPKDRLSEPVFERACASVRRRSHKRGALVTEDTLSGLVGFVQAHTPP